MSQVENDFLEQKKLVLEVEKNKNHVELRAREFEIINQDLEKQLAEVRD